MRPYWLLEIPCTDSGKAGPLRISTANEEFTVEFGGGHGHFERWAPLAGDNYFQSAELHVQAIMEEQIAAVSWLIDDFVKATSVMARGERIEQSFPIPAVNRVQIRSWKGTLDLEESLASLGERKAVL